MSLTRERLEQLIAHSTDIVVATERDGSVAYYNDGATRSLGYTADEVLGQPVSKLYPDVEEAKRVMRAMRSESCSGKGVVETFQTFFLSKAGERIPVAISGTILYGEKGQEDGTIGFAKDLREILRKEELVTLGEVAIGLSHEINNPLAVIVNQLELLEREVGALAGEHDCAVEFERLDAIRREIQRINEILERLRTMAHTESYETIDYIGPAKMIDLRSQKERDRAPDARLKGIRVLVVDDDPGICHSLCELLQGDGCEVQQARNGAEALDLLTHESFDVVLSDVVMPHMDGYELFKAIRERRPEIPVLMMTAFHYDKDHIIKRSRLLGLDAVIFKKPVDPARLRQVILEVTGRKEI